MNSTQLQEIFNRFNSMNIMVIGDVMVDAYMWGKVERISPEAPIPVISVVERENRLGGAANVALNIQSLGATPLLCSVTGDDEGKDLFISLMEKKGIITEGIIPSEGRRTTTKTRIIGGKQHLLRVDEEDTGAIGKSAEEKLIARINFLLSRYRTDAIIFEDYDKGVITPGVISEVLLVARRMGIPVSADPKKANFNNYKNIELFKPNLKELAEGMRRDISGSDIAAVSAAAAKLQDAGNIRCLLVTLSEKGVYLRHNGEGRVVPTEARDVADVSGAGDTVISVATACLAAGMDPLSMARVANLAGGLVCARVGVVPVDRRQLLDEAIRHFASIGG